jgi:hypothetical protein
MFIRPFVFGTIFIILSLGASGYLRGFISAIILVFLYPYLSWFYIIPVAFCHFFLGDKKFGSGLLTVLCSFFLLQQPSFWKLQAGIFTSASIREQLGKNIGELSYTSTSFYCMFVLIGILLLYPIFQTRSRKMNYGDLLLVFYLLPAIIYIRSFIDVLLPLVFVLHSKSLITILNSILHHTMEPWKLFFSEVINSLSARTPRCIILMIRNRNCANQSKISLKPYILILYSILILFVIKTNINQLKIINETENFLSVIPKNSTILSSFNQQYHILFVRPDLKIIPSSEIGMPSPEIRDEYIDFFKFGYFRKLAAKTSSSYLIEAKDIYLCPIEARHLEFIRSHDKLIIWKILDSPN